MAKREFKEIIQQGIQTKSFFVAVILRTAGFVLSIIAGIIAVPKSFNPVGTIIGNLIGWGFTLFLTILPLFEILRAKNSQNFRDDCDFGLKYLRVTTIITLVISALLVIGSLLLSVAVDFKFALIMLLSGAMLVHAIIQLEIINDLRNGLFYNVEKIPYATAYLLLTLVFAIGSVIFSAFGGKYFEVLTGLLNSASQIIIAYLIFTLNQKWKSEKLLSD